MSENNKIILYQDDNEIIRVSVRFSDEDLWLTQNQLAEIYCTTQQNISQHVDNIYKDGELFTEATNKKFLLVRQEGNRQVRRTLTITILTWLSPWAIVCNLRLQPVFAVGRLNGFMNISKRDLLWMMSG